MAATPAQAAAAAFQQMSAVVPELHAQLNDAYRNVDCAADVAAARSVLATAAATFATTTLPDLVDLASSLACWCGNPGSLRSFKACFDLILLLESRQKSVLHVLKQLQHRTAAVQATSKLGLAADTLQRLKDLEQALIGVLVNCQAVLSASVALACGSTCSNQKFGLAALVDTSSPPTNKGSRSGSGSSNKCTCSPNQNGSSSWSCSCSGGMQSCRPNETPRWAGNCQDLCSSSSSMCSLSIVTDCNSPADLEELMHASNRFAWECRPLIGEMASYEQVVAYCTAQQAATRQDAGSTRPPAPRDRQAAMGQSTRLQRCLGLCCGLLRWLKWRKVQAVVVSGMACIVAVGGLYWWLHDAAAARGPAALNQTEGAKTLGGAASKYVLQSLNPVTDTRQAGANNSVAVNPTAAEWSVRDQYDLLEKQLMAVVNSWRTDGPDRQQQWLAAALVATVAACTGWGRQLLIAACRMLR